MNICYVNCQKYIENMTKIENYVENKEENMKIKQIIVCLFFLFRR